MLNTENIAYLQVYLAEWSRSTRVQTLNGHFTAKMTCLKCQSSPRLHPVTVTPSEKCCTFSYKTVKSVEATGSEGTCAWRIHFIRYFETLEIKRNLEKEEDSPETEVSLLQLAAEECGRGAVETCRRDLETRLFCAAKKKKKDSS